MMNTRKTLLVLVAVNFVFMFVIIVLMSYLFYPLDKGMYRFVYLKKLHTELVKHKKETGELPNDLESLYRYDPNEKKLFFGSTPAYSPNDVGTAIHYEIRDGEPVLVDLGYDKKEGGIDGDIDVGYPYKCHFPFSDFIKTDAFKSACLSGLLFSLVFTGSLGLEWRRSRKTPVSVVSLYIGAILFGLIETVLAFIITLFDVFPHH